MDIAAVIVAAGLSSRMGSFKPMLKIGDRSVAKHVINTFHQAGINKVAVVTGYNADALQQHLADEGVVFLHNEHFRTSEMFDSAKIGLSHWVDTCDRVLFTPVDIPLFSPRTIEKLILEDAQVACPLCAGKRGHPLMLSAAAIRTILKDSGEGGLKGAISRLNTPMALVEVEDPGTLRDADTPEEFAQLLAYHASLDSTNSLYPTDSDIERMYLEAGTSDKVRAHCNAVAVKASYLADQASISVNRDLLRAACRLHDIARAGGKDHAVLAAEFLSEKGYPLLAQIIAQHHDLTSDASIEAELLYLADKLVKETEDVTLYTRFSESRKKCTSPEALEVWESRYRDTLRIVERYHLDVDTTNLPH